MAFLDISCKNLTLYSESQHFFMTRLGQFLKKKSVNKMEVSRRTVISKSRLSELSTNEKTRLQAEELYLIALAIDVDPCELLNEIYSETRLNKKSKK